MPDRSAPNQMFPAHRLLSEVEIGETWRCVDELYYAAISDCRSVALDVAGDEAFYRVDVLLSVRRWTGLEGCSHKESDISWKLAFLQSHLKDARDPDYTERLARAEEAFIALFRGVTFDNVAGRWDHWVVSALPGAESARWSKGDRRYEVITCRDVTFRYRNGRLHNYRGPAVSGKVPSRAGCPVRKDDVEVWALDGKYHRSPEGSSPPAAGGGEAGGGPAVRVPGFTAWYVDGALHRETHLGPALVSLRGIMYAVGGQLATSPDRSCYCVVTDQDMCVHVSPDFQTTTTYVPSIFWKTYREVGGEPAVPPLPPPGAPDATAYVLRHSLTC